MNEVVVMMEEKQPIRLTVRDLRDLIRLGAGRIAKSIQTGTPAEKLVEEARVLYTRLLHLEEIEKAIKEEQKNLKDLGEAEYMLMKRRTPVQEAHVQEDEDMVKRMEKELEAKQRELDLLRKSKKDEDKEVDIQSDEGYGEEEEEETIIEV